MKLSQLEHLIRAAGAIANTDALVVVGSQSILATIPNPPEPLVQSLGADLYPMRAPELAELIDGAIGEGSRFHDTYGYYAQGVGPETAILPATWQSRLHPLCSDGTNGITGYCLDPHDLALAKYAAARPKDRDFNRVMIQHGFLDRRKLTALLAEMPLEGKRRKSIQSLIDVDFETGRPN